MEQLVILLVVGALAGINWLIQKSQELREKKETEQRLDRLQREPQQEAPPRQQPVPGEEAARKFLEALGLPPESSPPERRIPPVPPIVAEPLSRQPETYKPQPAPLVVQAADLEKRLFDAPKPPPARREPRRRATARTPDPVSSSSIQNMLRTPEGLRQAVLAREILGPPKGLVF